MKIWLSQNSLITASQVDDPIKLHLAMWMGDTEFVKLRIRRGDDISTADANGWTALHLAVWNLHTDTVAFLLDVAPAQNWVSGQNIDGVSALYLAACNNDDKLIKCCYMRAPIVPYRTRKD